MSTNIYIHRVDRIVVKTLATMPGLLTITCLDDDGSETLEANIFMTHDRAHLAANLAKAMQRAIHVETDSPGQTGLQIEECP